MGLTNQLTTCTKELASVLVPLRPLLSTRNDFLWTSAHDIAFQQAKQLLTTAPMLTYFDPSKETRLHKDASTLGLGFLLLQKPTNSNSDWRVVQAGSRFLTDAESRYAVIELECLAVAWAIKKCHLFLADWATSQLSLTTTPSFPSSIHITWMKLKILACNVCERGSWVAISLPSGSRVQTMELPMPSPVTHTSNELMVTTLLSRRQTPTIVKQHLTKDSP